MLELLAQCESPFEVDACSAKLSLRNHLLNTFDIFLYVEQYGLFIVRNCFEQVMAFFADNLANAKAYGEAILSEKDEKAGKKEGFKRGC